MKDYSLQLNSSCRCVSLKDQMSPFSLPTAMKLVSLSRTTITELRRDVFAAEAPSLKALLGTSKVKKKGVFYKEDVQDL